jgi:hypothetical protein
MSAKTVTLLLLSCISTCLGSERDLVKVIFKDYDTRIRPVNNASTITTVGVQIQIIRLLEVVSLSFCQWGLSCLVLSFSRPF